MPLTGDQARQLHDATLSAFSRADLEQLVRFDLDERLENITPNVSLPTAVFDLIQWAERQGRTEDLIRAVKRARPSVRETQSVTQSLLSLVDPTWRAAELA